MTVGYVKSICLTESAHFKKPKKKDLEKHYRRKGANPSRRLTPEVQEMVDAVRREIEDRRAWAQAVKTKRNLGFGVKDRLTRDENGAFYVVEHETGKKTWL